jgi:hypothetical protein
MDDTMPNSDDEEGSASANVTPAAAARFASEVKSIELAISEGVADERDYALDER